MSIFPNNAPEDKNLVSKEFYENLDERFQDEYPIILYEPVFHSEERVSLINIEKENISLKNFANSMDASEFIQKVIATNIGLLVVVSVDYDENYLLGVFECLKKLICCRLSKFEEESFKKLFKSISPLNLQSTKVYKFHTKNGFHNEAPINKTEEEVLVMQEIEKMAKEFQEELLIWYDPGLKLPSKDKLINSLQVDPKSVFPYDFNTLFDKILSPNYPYHLIFLTGEDEATKVIEKLGHLKGLLRIYVCSHDAHKLKISNDKVKKIREDLKELVSEIQVEIKKRRKFDLPAFITTSDACNKQHIYNFHIFLKKLKFRNRDQAQKDFLKLAKLVHPRDKEDIQPLCKFGQEYTNYDETEILKWYTKPSPVFKLVNNCLRIATPDAITYARFVFKDLEQAIQDHYKRESNHFFGVVYRTAYLSQDEWKNLEGNQGQEVEMLGFLSTTKVKGEAMKLLTSRKVLMEIIIPPLPELETQGFADLTKISELPNEEEILFNVRSRFQILKTGIEKDKDGQEYRHALLFYGDPLLSSFLMRNKPSKRIKMKSPLDSNGNPSWKCHDCRELAEEVYEKQDTKGKKAAHKSCFECFQLNKKRKLDFSLLAEENPKVLWLEDNGEYEMAALDFQDSFPIDSSEVSQGDLFFEVEQYQQCILYCNNRLEQILTKRGREQERLRLYDLIGRSSKYLSLGEDAKEFLSNHLTITEFIFGKDHPKTAISYHNLAIVSMYLKTNKTAVQHFENSLKITQSFYHRESLKTVKALTTLAAMYMILQEKNKAIVKFKEALDITLEINGEIHSNTATAYINLSIAYQNFGEDKEAIECFKKALNALQMISRRNSPSKTASYSLLAAVFQRKDGQNVLQQFLEHLRETKNILTVKPIQDLARMCEILGGVQKGLQIFLETQDSREFTYAKENESLAILCESLGNMYQDFGKHWESSGDSKRASDCFKKAFDYFSQVLNLKKLIYGEMHIQIAAIYKRLSEICFLFNGDQKAVEFSPKASQIFKPAKGQEIISIECSYAEKCFENMKISENTEELSAIKKIHLNLAVLHNSQEKHIKALEHAKKAFSIEEALCEKNYSETVSLYNRLGLIKNQSLSDDKIVFQSNWDALKKRESLYDQRNLLLYYNDLALICKHSKKYSEALDHQQKALKISKLIYNEKHSETASSYNRIAILLEALEKYKEAQADYTKAQNIMKSICKENHLDIATSYNNIASVKVILAQFKEAFDYFSKALDIITVLKGEKHPSVGDSHLNLARVYRNQTEHDKERDNCEEALKIFQSVYGEKHPMTAASLNGIAIACNSLGEFQEAEAFQIKALKISNSIHGIKHFNTAASLNNLANLYAKQDKIEMALKISSKALEITRSIFGEGHSETASSLSNYASLCGKSKDHENALKYHMAALKTTESVYGKDHPQTARSYHNIALIYNEVGRKEEAEDNFKKAFQSYESNPECPRSDVATLNMNFAMMYNKSGDFEKALEFFKKALEIRKECFGENHPETKNAYENLAYVYESLGDAEKADEYLQKAILS